MEQYEYRNGPPAPRMVAELAMRHDALVRQLADAQATIAALQARVKELEAIKIPDDAFTYCAYCGEKSPVDEHNEDLSAHIKVCPKHPIRDVEAQLTQRTTELEAAKRKVDLAEKKAWLAAHDVGFFSMWNGTDYSGPPKLALLCNDTFAWATADCEDVLDEQIDTIVELFKSEGEAGVIKWIAQQRNMKPMESVGKWLFGCDAIKKERDDLHAELERVSLLSSHNERRFEMLEEKYKELRTLILTLPKVEGEISERFCTGSYYSSPYDYRSHVTFETALVALLKHRQGMEG